MTPAPTALPSLRDAAQGNRIRLPTLTLLRWTAVIGQSAALLAAWAWLHIDLNIAGVAAMVAASLGVNLAILWLYPAQRPLRDAEALAMLAFDVVQLVALLSLSGGISNPFALLVLAPVTIAATALRSDQTLALGALTVALVSVMALWAPPMQTRTGMVLAVPGLFLFGHWLAVVIGVAFLGLYARRVALDMQAMEAALFATQLALAREQRLCDLGGVVAAAAHELGTPLATIKLVSAELARDLRRSPADHADWAEDAALIRAEADRCSAILHGMGRAGKDDLHLRHAPLSAILREAAEPHQDRGVPITFDDKDAGAIVVQRQPELIHGLRNLIENAVDHGLGHVWVEASLTEAGLLRIRVTDDGPGFPPHLLPRIGNPFLGPRRGADHSGEEGMGLGLFIAKTLLERTGARLRFANGADPDPRRSGACVDVSWPRVRLEKPPILGGLGENPTNR